MVLSTFPKPTFDALIPVATLASVTALLASLSVVITPLATIGIAAVPVKSPANFKTPLFVASASEIFTLELLLPPLPFEIIAESTYVLTAFTDGNFISEIASALISSDKFP